MGIRKPGKPELAKSSFHPLGVLINEARNSYPDGSTLGVRTAGIASGDTAGQARVVFATPEGYLEHDETVGFMAVSGIKAATTIELKDLRTATRNTTRGTLGRGIYFSNKTVTAVIFSGRLSMAEASQEPPAEDPSIGFEDLVPDVIGAHVMGESGTGFVHLLRPDIQMSALFPGMNQAVKA